MSKSRLRWYGHVKRREQHNVCRRTLEAMPPAKRKRGRPRLRWMDCVRNDMKIIGVTENDASNRENWRRRVRIYLQQRPHNKVGQARRRRL